MAMIRLQKLLSSAGLGSRRACEEFIKESRVSVDGVIVTRLGAQADPELQSVESDGAPLKFEKKAYFLLNKPVGYLCTNKKDKTDRPLAVDLIPRHDLRLFCVGRLDVDSKGAIIITNDGALSNRVTHPRYNIPKSYRVRVQGIVGPEIIEKLSKGVWLSEGRTGGIDVKVIKTTRRDTVLRLSIKEGKNRIIRRIMASLDLRVTELERTRIGDIALGKLATGGFRELKTVEVKKLLSAKQSPSSQGHKKKWKPKRKPLPITKKKASKKKVSKKRATKKR